MAAHTNTSTQTDPDTADPTRRRRGNEHPHTTTRRATHGPRRLRRLASRTKSTSTELVPYAPPTSSPRPEPRSLRTQLAQLVINATQSVHRIHNRPPKTKTAKIVVVVPD